VKKIIIAAIVLAAVGGIFKGSSAPPAPQIPMQILERADKGAVTRMSVVVPDSVENSEANLLHVGKLLNTEIRGASRATVDIFTNVNAYKARKRILDNISNDDFKLSSTEQADYDQHFLAVYNRNVSSKSRDITVIKENVRTLPKKIDF
jgi:hypothetical protein